MMLFHKVASLVVAGLVVVLVGANAAGQCPGGVCPPPGGYYAPGYYGAPQQFGYPPAMPFAGGYPFPPTTGYGGSYGGYAPSFNGSPYPPTYYPGQYGGGCNGSRAGVIDNYRQQDWERFDVRLYDRPTRPTRPRFELGGRLFVGRR